MSEIDYIVKRIHNSYITSNKNLFDLYFELHLHVDELVHNNSINENIKIINKYSGDIYTALKNYNNIFSKIDIDDIDKENFYYKLAYYSIRYNTDIHNRIDKLTNLQ